MAEITKIWLATLTKDSKDAGTNDTRLNLTINIDGEDVLDRDFIFMRGSGWFSEGLGPDSGWLDRAQAGLSDEDLGLPIETTLLNNSSVRVGLRGDNAWGPENVLVLGQTERRVIPVAMETGIARWVSTDPEEGKLTMPLRLVSEGTSSTLIHRVLLLVYTSSFGSDSRIQLEITAGGNLLLQGTVVDTAQDDLEAYTANWYEFPVIGAPFTRGDIISSGAVRLSVLDEEGWDPKSVFVYGYDTASGRPNELVHLVSIPDWGFGAMDEAGTPFVSLPVV